MGFPQQAARELIRYLRGDISAGELRGLLTPLGWGVAVSGSEQDRRIAGLIELALAEFEAGHLTEEELRSELCRQFTLISDEQPEIIAGASVVQAPAPGLSPWAGKQSAAESSWQVVPRV